MYRSIALCSLVLGLVGCPGPSDTADTGETDADSDADADVDAAAAAATAYLDTELAAAGLARDTNTTSDEALVAVAESAADFGVGHGCDVSGVLSGVWQSDDVVTCSPDMTDCSGNYVAQWMNSDGSKGGDATGQYGDNSAADGGAFEGTWVTDDSASTGPMGGAYYAFSGDEGSHQGTWSSDTGSEEGYLAGVWVRLSTDGGFLYGVWGSCADVSSIPASSYSGSDDSQ